MSLKPVHIVQAPFFYPAGNTPAVCLSQSLPPEQDAALLLLGCGDIRNILFTVYGGAGTDDRKLDFTCCDLEAEIIARNLLALTLILDDTEGSRVRQLWNIYYHVFLDSESAKLLQSQAKKLVALAGSLDDWNKGTYGRILRFCDITTFANVVKLWQLYALEKSNGRAYTEAQVMLNGQWKAAKRLHNGMVTIDGVRSCAPLLIDSCDSIIKLYNAYWQSGTCFEDKKVIKGLEVANPMFACRRSCLILHYGTNPITGYHLAPLFTHLSADSPLSNTQSASNKGKTPRAMQAAISQLSAWCDSFRKASSRLIVRYVNSDAIAFCHVLQHHHAYGESDTAHWYRNMWTHASLVLDTEDYKPDGVAPTSFDVIDTSNLLDHVGCINILAATASLIRRKPTSVLRTEMLLPPELNVANSAKNLLCGDLPTVAALLGLKPVQHWTNATPVWHMHNNNLSGTPMADNLIAMMSRPVVLWKALDTATVRYNADELARLLLAMYLRMFQDEGFANLFSTLGLANKELMLKKMATYVVYTRASFAALLRHIKASEVVDWSHFIQQLVEQGIMNDQTLNMGSHHIQSLFVHLDMLSIWKLGDHFDWWHPRTFPHNLKGPFRDWQDIPAVVCVTLVVPHATVSMFGDLNNGHGTPICEIQLQSSISMKQSFYTDIQMGFGSIKPSGKAFTNEYHVAVQEDHKGWNGQSPLIVSAMVSTCALVEYGDESCNVAFALKQTPNSMGLKSKFGLMLQVHGSAVGQKDVFVSRYRPNMQGHVSVNTVPTSKSTEAVNDVNVTLYPLLSQGANDVYALRAHYAIGSGEAKALLQDGGTVEFNTPSPFRLSLTIGGKFHKEVLLPFPLNSDAAKVKVARKSLWIEYTAPVSKLQMLSTRPDSMLPVRLDEKSRITLEHLHYVQTDVLPKLHIGQHKNEWLAAHTSPMTTMSGAEFREYKTYLANDTLTMPGRLGVKESLQSIYAYLFGAQGQRQSSMFQLNTPISFFGVLYIDSVRMDVSNQTIFADAALVPFHSGADMHQIGSKLSKRSDIVVGVKMKDVEVTFWKHLLPAFAERCRQWQHRASCEYKTSGRIPLSTDPDKHYMCSCGLGVFPENYLKSVKQSTDLLKHAVRVTVPVIFSSPINTDDPAPIEAQPFAAQPSSVPRRSQENQAPTPRAEPRIVDPDAKKGTCFACGATSAKDGSSLLQCSRCKVAQYCSVGCQSRDWKGHKQLCKQLQSSR